MPGEHPVPPVEPELLMSVLDDALSGASRMADAVEIAVQARAGEYTRWAGEVIHQPQDVTETTYLVRAVVDGHAYRTATTSRRRLDDAIALAAAGAREQATGGAPGHSDVAGEDAGGAASYERVLALQFDDLADFDTAARVAAVRRAGSQAADVGAETAGMLGRAVTEQAVATSEGLRRVTVAGEAYGAMTATIDDGSAHWVDLSRSAARLQVDESIEQAIAQAVRGRGRVGLEPGTYPVVLGAEAAGELLQFLPALGFSGELEAAGIGLVAGSAGQLVAPGIVDIADDATLDVGLPIGFDLEGTVKARVPFLEHGRVGSSVTDRATALALGRPSTGHAHIAREQVPSPEAANIVMAAGADTEAELISRIAYGVYVQRFWYTRLVDRTRGTITGVTRDACHLIEDGRLTRPLHGMRFTQSVTEFLACVDGVGSVLHSQPVMNVWNGATSAPAVSGTAFRFGAAPARPTQEGQS